jgi:hypothetical protein
MAEARSLEVGRAGAVARAGASRTRPRALLHGLGKQPPKFLGLHRVSLHLGLRELALQRDNVPNVFCVSQVAR